MPRPCHVHASLLLPALMHTDANHLVGNLTSGVPAFAELERKVGWVGGGGDARERVTASQKVGQLGTCRSAENVAHAGTRSVGEEGRVGGRR